VTVGTQLRIVVVHNRHRSEQPSGEDRVVEQEHALLAGAGHVVTMFGRHSDAIADMSLLRKAAVPLKVPWNPAVRSELAAHLRAQRPDVVHIHGTFPLLSPSVVAACADVDVPAVSTLHNYFQACPVGTLYRAGRICTDCVGRIPLPAVQHGCYRNSRVATVPLAVNLAVNRHRWWSGVERFFCLSNAQRQTLIEAGMPPARLGVKPNFVIDRNERRSAPGEHLLYLGRLAEEKGLRLLMEAWDRLAAGGGQTLPLVVAGAGPLGEEISRWAHGRHDVRYLGLLDASECATLMSRAAAVVAPSVWLEACPLVLLEAMAAGVPAVVASQGAPAELVEDGITGLLYRPGDPTSLAERLRDIVAALDRNWAMGKAARQLYEKEFTPAVGLKRLIDGYGLAIRGSRARQSIWK
jgi:glycosyltransferase involved in cell wall biosynthesis